MKLILLNGKIDVGSLASLVVNAQSVDSNSSHTVLLVFEDSHIIRRPNPGDAHALLELFLRTIRVVNSADFDPTQIDAWASDDIDGQEWQDRFAGRLAYVARDADCIAGFADMTNDGYLDRLYVSADHQRQGVARALLARLTSDACEFGISQITTNA